MVRYRVEIDTFGISCCERVIRRNVSLAKAWRIAERAARRGAARFGGSLIRSNWGARGGQFPALYRVATIRAERI
jgi:hypothetical protein